jgi:hypothetical protein
LYVALANWQGWRRIFSDSGLKLVAFFGKYQGYGNAIIADKLPLPYPVLSDHFYPFGRQGWAGATFFSDGLKKLSGNGK